MSGLGLLVVISGPGGVGKDTLIEMLRARQPGLRYSVSYTTRPRRDYEVDGEHYRFVDDDRFARLAAEGALLENARVNGHLYGTSAAMVQEARDRGEDMILKIDVQGAEQVRERCPDAVFVFVAPPSMDELHRRRVSRGSEAPDEIEARQRLAEVEMGYASRYDHVVVNDAAARAVSEIEGILAGARERQRAGRR
ncbi:MAG TPA: guanylate kinase [Candidatus Dormibacteraeota bacterium]|nr:guanylate kinase [Candidatus Dormibacteraeota bacterium]